jgi:iron complex outermembrane recepter protein
MQTSKSTFLLLILILSLAVPQVVLGAGEDNSTRTDKGQGYQENQAGPNLFQLEQMTVTATKTKTPLEDLPVTAYTVDRKNIEAQPTYFRDNYGSLIMDVPGVHVAQGPLTAPPWVNLRGTGYFVGRTLYLVDGLPVTSSTTPMLTTTVNNNDIERVDILLGPSSALYGANAAGGVINIITRRGTPTTGANTSLDYGSFNTYRPNVSVGNTAGNYNYYVSYSGDYSDGFKNNPVDGMLDLYRNKKTGYLASASVNDVWYDNSYLAGKFGWQNEAGAGAEFAYNYAHLNISGGQPNLTSIDNGNQGLGQLKFYTPIADFMKATLTAGQQFWDRPSNSNYGLSLVNNELVLDTRQKYANDSRLSRFPVDLQTDFNLAENNILTAGFNYSNERLSSSVTDSTTGKLLSATETGTDQEGVYLQDQWFLLDNKLSLLAGIRYDRWEYHGIYDSASTPQHPEGFMQDTVTYRGGVKYRFNDIFAVRSSAGTAFWPGAATWFFQNTKSGSTWREANPDLKPEKTWMVDVGFETTLSNCGTFFGVTPYYGQITDMIAYRYDTGPSPGITIIRTRNVGEADIYGAEFLLTQRITSELSAFASLTLNHSEIVSDPVTGTNVSNEGHQVTNAPDYFGSIGLRYLNPKLVNASATLRFSDSRYYDSENTQLPFYYMNAYESFDIKIWREWDLTKEVRLITAFSAENLFGRDYQTEFIYVAPGRNFSGTVGVKYKF